MTTFSVWQRRSKVESNPSVCRASRRFHLKSIFMGKDVLGCMIERGRAVGRAFFLSGSRLGAQPINASRAIVKSGTRRKHPRPHIIRGAQAYNLLPCREI